MKLKLKYICKLTKGRQSQKKNIAKNGNRLNGKSRLRVSNLKNQTYDVIKKIFDIKIKLIKNHNQLIFKKINALGYVWSNKKLKGLMNDFYSFGDVGNINNQNKITNKYLYYFLLRNRKKDKKTK